MPVAILTSLMLWSSLVAPAARVDRPESVTVARAASAADPTATIRSWPLPEPCSWTIPDADTAEEETGDGDPEALISDADWLALSRSGGGQVSSIRPDRGVVPQAARLKVLRC